MCGGVDQCRACGGREHNWKHNWPGSRRAPPSHTIAPTAPPQVLLYTERAQFYNRHRIRGAREILFYQLPEHAAFYAELLNLLEESEAGETPTVTALFSRYDALRLERVVGAARADKMLRSRKTSTFLFC